MSQITLLSETIPLWQTRYTDIELWLLPNNPFVTSEGVVIPSGNIQNKEVFQRIPCTTDIVNKTLTIAEASIYATTDARDNPNGAIYSLWFFRSNGTKLRPYDNFHNSSTRVPPTIGGLTVYSHADLIAYTNLYSPNRDFSGYTKPETDRLLNDIRSSIGTVNNPVVSGVLTAALSTTAGALQRATDVVKGLWYGTGTKVINLLLGKVHVDDFSTLALAVAGISTTPRTLIIPNTQNVTATLTIPRNVSIDWGAEGMINVSAGQTLTINGETKSWPARQLFTGSGTVKLNGPGGINIVWFGTVGDGTTNDYTAINKALTAVSSIGNRVYAPTPSVAYLIGTPLAVPNTTIFEGDGDATIIKCSTGMTAVAAFQLTGKSNVRIRNLRISQASSIQFGVNMGACTNCVAENLHIDAAAGWGVFIGSDSRQCGAINCTSEGTNLSHNIEINASSYCFAYNCTLLNAFGNAVEVYHNDSTPLIPVRGNKIINCHIQGSNGGGILPAGDVGTIIDGCTFFDTDQAAVAVQQSAAGAAFPSIGGKITNCTIINCGTDGVSGVVLSENVKGWSVDNNLVQGSGLAGIEIRGSENSITGNHSYLNNGHGIYCEANQNIIKNNHCINNSVSGAAVANGIIIIGDRNNIDGNIATDTRTPKLQAYGLQILSGANNKIGINEFSGNLSGTMVYRWGDGGIIYDENVGLILDGYVWPDEFRLYNLRENFTGNEESLIIGPSSNIYSITSAATGTGVARPISFAGVPVGLTNGGTVASATTLPIPGNSFHVSGNTTITAFATTGIPNGVEVTIIFDSNPQLTHSSVLNLAGSINFTPTAGTRMRFLKDGGVWYESGARVQS